MGGVDRRFARAVEDTPLPPLDDPDHRISYEHPAMEFIHDSVVGYIQVEKTPGYGDPGHGSATQCETYVLGKLEGEQFIPVEEPEEQAEIMENLGLNNGVVRFLNGGVPAPGEQF